MMSLFPLPAEACSLHKSKYHWFALLTASMMSVSVASVREPGEVEIEFAPMEVMGQADPMDMMFAGAPDRSPKGARGVSGPARGGRERELDNMLAGMFGAMMNGGGARQMRQGGRGGAPEVTEEIVMEGPDGTEVFEVDGAPGMPGAKRGKSAQPKGKSSIPGGVLRDLFPGAMLAPGGIVIEGDDSGGADPMMMDMLQDLDSGFAKEMLPAIQKATSSDRDPAACRADIQKNCAGAKSHLHCLGIHHNTISDACRKQVGQSVPFLCSKYIDRFCDVLQTGILNCLYNHVQEIDGQCRDAVMTTKHVISKVNTQQASLVDRATGAKKINTPMQKASRPDAATLAQREANLDAKLGVPRMESPAKPASAQSEAQLDAKLALMNAATAAKSTVASVEGQLDSKLRALSAIPRAEVQHHRESGYEFSEFLFIVAIVACGAYLGAFTDFGKQMQSHLFQTSRDRSDFFELPKPDAL